MVISEVDLVQEEGWYHAHLAQKAVRALKRRNLTAFYAPHRQEALAKVMELIPKGATVVCGDSVTLHEVGVFEALTGSGDYNFLNPFARDAEGNLLVKGQERLDMERKAFTADVFLCGINALTLDGRIVNVDGAGNRVAPTIFGPKRVIMVTGANKVVKNLEEAMRRVHEVAAPINARRHYMKHHMEDMARLPCYQSGLCVDCLTPERICCFTVTIEGQRAPNSVPDYLPRIHVVVVGEKLGI